MGAQLLQLLALHGRFPPSSMDLGSHGSQFSLLANKLSNHSSANSKATPDSFQARPASFVRGYDPFS
jgi:hypothetical protein